MTPASDPQLERIRQRRQRAIAAYRQAGFHQKAAGELLELAELEAERGERERAILALRSIEAMLASPPLAELERTGPMHERLAALWQRYGDQRGKPRPVEAIAGQFDLAEELAFVWADLNAERTLLEIEKQKSAALIRVMHDDMRERDGRLATTLAELGTAQDFVRPMDVAGRSEVFVDYMVGDEETIVLLERPGAAFSSKVIGIGRERIDRVISDMRRAFDGGGMFMPIIPDHPFDVSMEEVYRLGRELMPFIDELAAADLVSIFPHGALHSFPFAAIPLADGSPLIEHAAVAISPSSTSACRRSGSGTLAAGPAVFSRLRVRRWRPRRRRAGPEGVPRRGGPPESPWAC